MHERLQELWSDEKGVVTVEYALLLSVLVVGMASVWQMLRAAIENTITNVANTLSSAPGTPSG